MLHFPVCRHPRSVPHCRRHPGTFEEAAVEDVEGFGIKALTGSSRKEGCLFCILSVFVSPICRDLYVRGEDSRMSGRTGNVREARPDENIRDGRLRA
jgi:hypothetical protein